MAGGGSGMAINRSGKYFFRRYLEFFWDLLFPIECLHCGREEAWLCAECFQKIKSREKQNCPGCGGGRSGRICEQCRGRYNLDGLLIAGDYDDVILQKLIKALKYKYVKPLASILAEFLLLFWRAEAMEELGAVQGSFGKVIFLPVPLHRRRLRFRGFNQAEMILNHFAEKSGLTVCLDILRRKFYTKPQAQLGEEQRLENIKNAFQCARPEAVRGKMVIVFDDVATTGATLDACAKALKEAGAKEVWGLALAKG